MQLVLTEQAANALSGTWSATFKNGDSFSGLAVAELFSYGYAIILYVQQLAPCETGSGPGGSAPIGFTLINVAVTSSQLTAVAGRLLCTGGPLFGTINLAKQ